MTSRRSAHKDKFSLFGQSVQRELTTLSVASLAGSLAGSDISFPSTAWMQMNHCNSMNVEADCTISALCSIQADFSHVSGFYFHEPVAEEEQDVGNVIMSLTCSISFCRFSSLCFWELNAIYNRRDKHKHLIWHTLLWAMFLDPLSLVFW